MRACKCLIDIWAPLKENSGSRIHSFILNLLLLHFQSSDHKICRTKLLHNTVLQVNFFFPSSALYWPLKHQKIVQHCTNWRTHTHVIEIKSWFFYSVTFCSGIIIILEHHLVQNPFLWPMHESDLFSESWCKGCPNRFWKKFYSKSFFSIKSWSFLQNKTKIDK